MPIEIKNYTWNESEGSVYITLPLNKGNKNKVDIFYSNEYLKVSYPPYFFELCLPHKIWTDLNISDLNEDAIDNLCEDNGVKCLINNNQIFLELLKLKQAFWNDLCPGLSKDERKEQRLKAVEWRHKYEELLKRKKLRQERARDRQAISDSIDEDEMYRNKLQEKKEKIKSDFFIAEGNESVTPETRIVAQDYNNEKPPLNRSREDSNAPEKNEKKINSTKDIIKNSNYSIALASRVAVEEERLREIPPPRNCPTYEDSKNIESSKTSSIIITTFTPKATKGPLREGRNEEKIKNDMEWKKKDYQEKNKLVGRQYTNTSDESEDNNISESDCQHLLEKGEQFFKKDDFASAIGVFTHGIENVNPMFAPFHNNRGAVNLKVGNLHGVITDCSRALELLVPKCTSNEIQRAKAHVRIGTGKYTRTIVKLTYIFVKLTFIFYNILTN